MQRITEYLTADHIRLRALLDHARAGSTLDLEAFASFRAALLRHIRIEERLLYPALRSALRGQLPPAVRELQVEHAAITTLLRSADPDLAVAREIAAVLTQHEATEHGPDGAYAQCERVLNDLQSRVLAQRAWNVGPVSKPLVPYAGAGRLSAGDALELARRSLAEWEPATH